jgi:hypothetical protein
MKTKPQNNYIKFDVKLPNNKIVTITINVGNNIPV